MTDRMPALSLSASPGRRQQIIELAQQAEQRGFSGIHCPSFGDALGLCLAIATQTTELQVATAIQPIYLQHPVQLATQAAFLHEVSGGRFTLGVGVTHGPVTKRLGVQTGKPLTDMGNYIAEMRLAAESVGELPPIVLATLRDKMLALAVEVADGAVWANAARSAMGSQLSSIPAERRSDGFTIADMIPTCIDDDRAAAAARNRKTLSGYVRLPNYRNYWHDHGYAEEMTAAAAAIDARDNDALAAAMTDRWLADATLYGSTAEVRDGVEAWFDAGVDTPILVPSSTSGGQAKAVAELFEAFAK